VRSDGPEIDEEHVVLARISKQIELSHAAKLVDPELCKVDLLFRLRRDLERSYNRCAHLDHDVIPQLLVASDEAPGLAHLPAHAIAERGVKCKLSSWGSAMLIRLSAIKEAGRSGLSSAARPTFAQNST
jgi:hypothetical protein